MPVKELPAIPGIDDALPQLTPVELAVEAAVVLFITFPTPLAQAATKGVNAKELVLPHISAIAAPTPVMSFCGPPIRCTKEGS